MGSQKDHRRKRLSGVNKVCNLTLSYMDGFQLKIWTAFEGTAKILLLLTREPRWPQDSIARVSSLTGGGWGILRGRLPLPTAISTGYSAAECLPTCLIWNW